MIVCLCEGLSERKIQSEINRGAASLKEIGRRCGAGTHCGMCRKQMRGMMRKAHSGGASSTGTPAVALAPMND